MRDAIEWTRKGGQVMIGRIHANIESNLYPCDRGIRCNLGCFWFMDLEHKGMRFSRFFVLYSLHSTLHPSSWFFRGQRFLPSPSGLPLAR